MKRFQRETVYFKEIEFLSLDSTEVKKVKKSKNVKADSQPSSVGLREDIGRNLKY